MFQQFFSFLILIINHATELLIVVSCLLEAINIFLKKTNILSNTLKKQKRKTYRVNTQKNYHDTLEKGNI